MEMVHDRCSTLLTEFCTPLTTILPILFQYCYKYCYSDSRNLWAVLKAGGLALSNLIQPTISLEMPVPSQGHYVLTVFRLLTDFVYLYTYEFWLSLCKIFRSSVILLLPLFKFCNVNAFFSFDLYMVYIPECMQQQLRTMK